MDTLARKMKRYGICLGLAGLLGLTSVVPAWNYFGTDSVVTKVTGTGVKRYNSKDIYLIYTHEGTFRNVDAWYRGKFRSSDIQGQAMEFEKTQVEVRIKKYGWRIPFMSAYENVVGIEEIKAEEKS